MFVIKFLFTFLVISAVISVLSVILTVTIRGEANGQEIEKDCLNAADDVGEALFLTPYIEAGDLETARHLALVQHPGFSWVTSYAGFLTIHKDFNSNMFFWYFRAQNDSDNAPVLLWLQGGPGITSLYGLFVENGPFSVNEKLEYPPREFSWHKNHHLLYIDNPVGTGFSFTDDEEGYSKTEAEVGQNLHEALQQFFTLFPDLRKRDFFLSGESYGGKFVPALGYYIHQQNSNATENEVIRLKGMAIGDGLSDPINQLNYGDYLFQIGLIDHNGKKLLEEYVSAARTFIQEGNYIAAFETLNSLVSGENALCKNLTGFSEVYNYINPEETDYSEILLKLVEDVKIRRAMHVGNRTFHGLDDSNLSRLYLINDIMKSVAPWISELLNDYQMVFYNGQLDIIVAYPLTVNFLRKLNFTHHEEYLTAERHIWRVDEEIAGYFKKAGNLVEILVRNAGHMVPMNQPKWALEIILYLTHGKSFT
ncbi:venom serine carboxypeptidase-like [Sergentomyia squamirostris]